MSHAALGTLDILAGIDPVNLATGANTGLRVKMDDCDRLLVVMYKDAGAEAEGPVLSFYQHDDAAAGNTADLNVSRIWVKQAAALVESTPWTLVTQTADEDYDMVAGNTEAIVVVEIAAEDLNRTSGYYWVSADIADVGDTAQIGCLFYIKTNLRKNV